MNELKYKAQMLVQSHAAEVKDINDKVKELENLITDQPDPNWETLALGMISHLQDPIHNMILSWSDWYMTQNGLGLK